jgi:hypothetical protein
MERMATLIEWAMDILPTFVPSKPRFHTITYHQFMKSIAYGEGYFPTIIRDNFFFVDKTDFIPKLEQASARAVFLRPRRFGKSLWVSILQHYYGLQHAPIFTELFGELYIGQNPTPLANKFAVLHFDFSGVNTDTFKSTFEDFLLKTQKGAGEFLYDYQHLFPDAKRNEVVVKAKSPGQVLLELFYLCKTTPGVPPAASPISKKW